MGLGLGWFRVQSLWPAVIRVIWGFGFRALGFGFTAVVHGAEVRHGAVQQLGHNALGEALNRLALGRREPRQLALDAPQLRFPDAGIWALRTCQETRL